MIKLTFSALGMVVISGCAQLTFTSLGNGVAVPSSAIDEHAEANGVLRDEARRQMREALKGEQN